MGRDVPQWIEGRVVWMPAADLLKVMDANDQGVHRIDGQA